MAEIDIKDLAEKMIAAAKGSLDASWKDAKPFAEQQFKTLAENVSNIVQMRLSGQIDDQQAKLYLDTYKSSTRVVLLTVEGLGILAVESAINAALSVAKDTINTAIGFVLI